MAWQIRRKMGFDADWADSWASAAVRDTKSLMQIQVTNIRTKVSRTAESNKRIHIRPVHIDLAPMAMDYLAELPDSLFEDTMGRRIGDHQGAEPSGILIHSFSEIVEIDVTLGIALHGDDLKSSHCCGGRIGAVR